MHLHRSPSWTPPRWIPRSLRLHLRREEDLVSLADAAAPIAGFPNSQSPGSRQCKELQSLKTQTAHSVLSLLNPVTAGMLFEDPHPYQRTKSSHLPFPLITCHAGLPSMKILSDFSKQLPYLSVIFYPLATPLLLCYRLPFILAFIVEFYIFFLP